MSESELGAAPLEAMDEKLICDLLKYFAKNTYTPLTEHEEVSSKIFNNSIVKPRKLFILYCGFLYLFVHQLFGCICKSLNSTNNARYFRRIIEC